MTHYKLKDFVMDGVL